MCSDSETLSDGWLTSCWVTAALNFFFPSDYNTAARAEHIHIFSQAAKANAGTNAELIYINVQYISRFSEWTKITCRVLSPLCDLFHSSAFYG
jgi:hypothetical protein